MTKRMHRIFVLILASFAVFCLFSCDAILSDGIDSHTHDYEEWGVDTATCTEVGTQTRVCKTCEETETRKTAPLGHDMIAFADGVATCTENGYKNYTECSRCGYSVGEKTNALGHDLSVWYGSTATCTKSGIEYSDCGRCDYSTNRVAEALGHNLTGDYCSVCKTDDILVLIQDGTANFKVVSTFSSGSYGKIAADEFVKLLRDLGINVDDAVVDNQSDQISECEIIIGKNALGRGDECNISSDYLGRRGEAIKRVGNRIIIAASTGADTMTLFENFIANTLKITEEAKDLKYLETTEMHNYESITEYGVNSIKINSTDLSNYEIVLEALPYLENYEKEDIEGFRDALYSMTGYDLNVISPQGMSSGKKYFIIRYAEDVGEEGFRVYVDGKNLVVECAYENAFNKAFAEFASANFLNAVGDVSFDASYVYTKVVSKVYYEDFGAVGDGETCDYEAIFNAHTFANACGQKVFGKAGATYYISPEKFLKSIPVKTDVDFCGATFIVDDEGELAYRSRKQTLFSLEREYDSNTYLSYTLENLCGTKNLDIPKGTTELTWLAPVLEAKSMVEITSAHRDYIRHGSNQNNGAQRIDVVIINPDGTLAEDTPIAYDFEDVIDVVVYRVDDKPITVENGNFYNICCKTVIKTFYDKIIDNGDGTTTKVRTTHANKYDAYKRGFGIFRSNVTIKKLSHAMIDEPKLGTYSAVSGYTPDDLHDEYGSRHESYPYYGFLFVDRAYNLNVLDTELTGHTTYYEDKPAQVSTGGEIPEPVPMGSYDFVLEYSSNVTFKNVVQICETGIGDSRYWGIMSSNGSRNLTFDGCAINRFDAHRGFNNATLKNTTIGHTINVIGQGTFVLDGVTKIIGNTFVSLRGDYGATFQGDMIFKDCVFENHPAYKSNKGGSLSTAVNTNAYIINSGFNTTNSGWSDTNYNGAYWLWDFGYTCYMPENITIQNFTSNIKSNGKTYLFNDLPDIIFECTYVEGEEPTNTTVRYPYQLTKSVTYIGMTPFKMCSGTKNTSLGYTYNKLNSIPVLVKDEAQEEEQ